MHIASMGGLSDSRWILDYMSPEFPISARYDFHPGNKKSSGERLAWLAASEHTRVDRGALTEALERYNRAVGNTQAAMENIAALRDKETSVTVAGQQAGLWTGPLLVIYKAVTVLQAARQAEAQTGKRTVPVFWIAGEDHDYDEVNHTYFQTPEPALQKLEAPRSPEGRIPVSSFRWTKAEWEQTLSELNEVLPDTDYKAALIGDVRQAAFASSGLADCFARMMVRLFGKYGLIVMDAADPEIRRLESPMFHRLIRRNEQYQEALLEGSRQVAGLGYPLQAEIRENMAHLFYIHNGERTLLYRTEQGFADRSGEVSLTEAELLELAETRPEMLSNNVFTRPLMQEYVLPVLQTVLGPAELAYWAVLKEAFRLSDFHMPTLLPRPSFTIVEGTLQKYLDKFELEFVDIVQSFEARREAWLRAQDQYRLEERFDEVKQKVEKLYEPLIETIAQINPGMRKLGQTNLHKISEQIDFLKKRAEGEHQSRYEASLRQWDRLRLSIRPMDKPQERVYNILAYLNKYGSDWLDELINRPPFEPEKHHVIYM